MPLPSNSNLDDAILHIIYKDRNLLSKTPLVDDMAIINNVNTTSVAKLASYERLISYLSHLPAWDEELITYLGNRFMELKLKQ